MRNRNNPPKIIKIPYNRYMNKYVTNYRDNEWLFRYVLGTQTTEIGK
jgi:hypothetical protein